MLAPTRKQRVTGISPAFKKRRVSGNEIVGQEHVPEAVVSTEVRSLQLTVEKGMCVGMRIGGG